MGALDVPVVNWSPAPVAQEFVDELEGALRQQVNSRIISVPHQLGFVNALKKACIRPVRQIGCVARETFFENLYELPPRDLNLNVLNINHNSCCTVSPRRCQNRIAILVSFWVGVDGT